MRKVVTSICVSLLLAVVLFPPMTVEAEYLGGTESSISIKPIWSVGNWDAGQVSYHAEINIGLMLAAAIGALALAALSWTVLPSKS
jgi:hypothetical protein